jgi:Cu/Ag efflux protein CusF
MRIFLGALAATSLIGLAGAAYAAEATGAIKSVDANKNVVTLDNGSTYDMAKNVSLAGFKPGEKVTVTYTQSGKMMDGKAIKPAA